MCLSINQNYSVNSVLIYMFIHILNSINTINTHIYINNVNIITEKIIQ